MVNLAYLVKQHAPLLSMTCLVAQGYVAVVKWSVSISPGSVVRCVVVMEQLDTHW